MITVTNNSVQQINAALLTLNSKNSASNQKLINNAVETATNTANINLLTTTENMTTWVNNSIAEVNTSIAEVNTSIDGINTQLDDVRDDISDINTDISEINQSISNLQYVTGHLTELSSPTPTFTFYSRDQDPDSTGVHYYATGWIASYNISPYYPIGYTGETTIDLYTQFYPHSQWGYEVFLVITENHPINGFKTFTEGLTAWEHRESLVWLYTDNGITTELDPFAINQYWNDHSWVDSVSSSSSRFHMHKVGLNLSTHFGYGSGHRVFYANIIKVNKELTTNIDVPRSYEPSQLVLDIRKGYYNYHIG